MEFNIRNYHPSDLTSLYRICLQTGNSGTDASHLYDDPDLLGHYYAAPYAVLEPEVCFVVTADDSPCGYIVGTRHSQLFRERCELEWFPVLRRRYSQKRLPENENDRKIIQRIHDGIQLRDGLEAYPAHLHIDLLPVTQGQGMGRKITEVFIKKLKELQVGGLHLEVGKTNTGAIGFYEKIGFQKLQDHEYSLVYGMTL